MVRLPAVVQPASGITNWPAAKLKLAAPLITGALCTRGEVAAGGQVQVKSPFTLALVRLEPLAVGG